MRPARLSLPVLPLLLLAACSSRSEVVELAPEVFALTVHSPTPAAAARGGVEDARRHCAARGADFEVVRSAIGARDYQIAFRCPRRQDAPLANQGGALTPEAQEATSGLPNPFLR